MNQNEMQSILQNVEEQIFNQSFEGEQERTTPKIFEERMEIKQAESSIFWSI